MPRPDKDTPEYAAYKANKRAARARRDVEEAAAADKARLAAPHPHARERSRSKGQARAEGSDGDGSETERAGARAERKGAAAGKTRDRSFGRYATAGAGDGCGHGDRPSLAAYGGAGGNLSNEAQAAHAASYSSYPADPPTDYGVGKPPQGVIFNHSYAHVPAPPPPGTYGVTSISAPPPPQPGVYPTVSAPPPPPPHSASFPTAAQGRPALHSTVPSVFQYQTGGPSAIVPYGGDMSAPPNLDPSNLTGPLPGEGAGKVYPPGQAPPQFDNPDYYHQVLSDSTTTHSLTQSITASTGMGANAGYAEGNGKPNGNGLSGKLGKLGIPSLSKLSLSPGGGGSNGNGSVTSGTLPPPSPALLPYHGTYQSISPMPSPVFGAQPSPLVSASGSIGIGKHRASGSFSIGPSAFSKPSLNLHGRPTYEGEGHGRSYNPTATPTSSSSGALVIASPHGPPSRVSSPSPDRAYNPASDAKAILEELRHTFTRPSPKPLIEILPTLTPQQLKSLRKEYKSLYRGVNLAKHIKSVFTTSTPFGKIVFAVALGPYESEAWFSNGWYQKKETRNELLIEALMGKSNAETEAIKACFKDAKYDSSLEKAVAEELPANKFRVAVMAQLSCARMDESTPLSDAGVREDVARLGTILERGQGAAGGETEMVGIMVNRSDRWLFAVAQLYRQVHQRDLAKAVMKHSKNLVVRTDLPLPHTHPHTLVRHVLTQCAGRNTPPHPLGRDGPAAPRREAAAPGARGGGRAKPRGLVDLPCHQDPLGPEAPQEGQESVQEEVRRFGRCQGHGGDQGQLQGVFAEDVAGGLSGDVGAVMCFCMYSLGMDTI